MWLFIRRHQPGYRCVQWHPSVGVVHTSSPNPAVVFHMVLCMFSRITFLHLLRVPCGTGQPCLIQGCDNLRRTFARRAPLLLKNPEIPDDMVHPVPGTVLKIPGTPDHCTVITDNQAKLFAVVILDKDVPVLCGNSFGMFAGKGPSGSP